MLQIETGIEMPTSTRPKKGDSRMNAIKDSLAALQHKAESFLLPMKNLEQATEERRHYVFRANKFGKLHGKEFIVAAVDGQPAVAADPEKGIAAKEATKPGLRFWLADEPETVTEKPAESANNAEQAQQAPEVAKA